MTKFIIQVEEEIKYEACFFTSLINFMIQVHNVRFCLLYDT